MWVQPTNGETSLPVALLGAQANQAEGLQKAAPGGLRCNHLEKGAGSALLLTANSAPKMQLLA